MFTTWPINEAGTPGVGTTRRPLTTLRGYLAMATAKVTRGLRVRKHCAAPKIPNGQASLTNGEAASTPEVGPLHALLSDPPPKPRAKRFEALKAPAKRALIAAYCHGVLGAKTTQRLIDKFGLKNA